jgi:hypothetical protein
MNQAAVISGAAGSCPLPGHSGKHLLVLSLTGFDPNVWSGRALQESFVDLGGCGLASMYPVSD